MTSHKSTREVLLTCIDEIEIIAKELLDNLIAQKQQKPVSAEHSQLVELVLQKDTDLKATLKLAEEQGVLQQKVVALETEVERHDIEIRNLQKQLKEAEQLLATAIFQAKQKLQAIAKANSRPVNSEELIKFAHRISASNAVCAPLNWQQGDLRRPYPTDIEMRLGFLGRLGEMNVNGHISFPELLHRPNHSMQQGSSVPNSQAGTYSWLSQNDLQMPGLSVSHLGVGGGMDHKTPKKENEDVDVMSTDSSSSSSSDSQ
ncbi:Mediator of RNA polymerase II transcription subunit 4 [Daphnia magna]|uniref:Mediator of RNA polymerase II transcription subunit 4 n=1 Tax=Daphnia magna TaxID=35525 RepID=A0A164XQ32_9CRUS|nr:Mediator of RNA polymerase II transcription subunit 4 [Daphnia magna]CAG4639537.1 EOG090X0DX5 [Daphnia magna]SVE83324.1 EOG090X0DX5 [Daphnia magna]